MKLKFLTGDVNFKQFGAKWISKKFNNGDFDYWLVVELINMKDATGEENIDTYNISISAIAPSQVSEKDFKAAVDGCGWHNNNEPYTDIDKVMLLSDYGISAHLWSMDGNNFKTLWKDAHKELMSISMLFGFYMDKPENRVGNTGWDFINGEMGLKV